MRSVQNRSTTPPANDPLGKHLAFRTHLFQLRLAIDNMLADERVVFLEFQFFCLDLLVLGRDVAMARAGAGSEHDLFAHRVPP